MSGKKFTRPKKALAASKPNPFDLKVNKVKFDVLNRKAAGVVGRPARARARSHEVRQKTLVPELRRTGRSSEFLDKRFGERDNNLTSEDKMLERYSRERLRKSKKAKFNLNTEENELDYDHTLSLTHRGRSFDDPDALLSDPEDSDICESEDDHGFDGERSRQDIMQEIIAKSKMHRLERQKAKEENMLLCQDLDEQFSSIAKSLPARESSTQSPANDEDDYFKVMKQMSFDGRAQPADRVKSAQEIEASKMAKLEKARNEQTMRMKPEMDADDTLEDDSQDADSSKSGDAQKSLRKVMSQIEDHLERTFQASTLQDTKEPYLELVSLARTNSVIPLARVFRERLARLSSDIGRLLKRGKTPLMPDHDDLILFHLIGRLFSTSDYHHVVSTPAQLVIGTFLQHGRIVKPRDLVSAIFLMQTAQQYQKESGRIFPEIFSLLYSLISVVFDCQDSANTWTQYTVAKRASRSVVDAIRQGLEYDSLSVRPIKFEDLVHARDDLVSPNDIVGWLLHVLKESLELYRTIPVARSVFAPLLNLLADTKNANITPAKSTTTGFAAHLWDILDSTSAVHEPLRMQTFKPIPLPLLTPDLTDGLDKEEREAQRFKHAFRRERKGAKRELKRDNAFLAEHKFKERKEADRKYQDRLRNVMGTIANDGARASQLDSRKRRPHRSA